MFHRQTLFVVGAGASAEFDLPVGRELARQIGEMMDIRYEFGDRSIGTGDTSLYGMLTQQMRRSVHEYQQAAWLIRDGIALAQSIDDFIDLHRNNPFVVHYGKAALAKAILKAERNSRLFVDRHNENAVFNPAQIADTWLVRFVHMVGRGVPRENVCEIFDRVSFIVFNYDRCIEYFLQNALRLLYGIREDEAYDIVANLHIIHPYGVVGNAPFGNGRADYAALAEQVKTYTEQMTNGNILKAVRDEVERAQCIVFFGFAYHSQNLLMLKPASPMRHKLMFGTAHGMSDADVEVVSHNLAGFFHPIMDGTQRENHIKIENKLKCAALFDNYARSLSGGD
jgi:hypothetical protein